MKKPDQFLDSEGRTVSDNEMKKSRKSNGKMETKMKHLAAKKKTPMSVFAKDNITSIPQYRRNLSAQETAAGHMKYPQK